MNLLRSSPTSAMAVRLAISRTCFSSAESNARFASLGNTNLNLISRSFAHSRFSHQHQRFQSWSFPSEGARLGSARLAAPGLATPLRYPCFRLFSSSRAASRTRNAQRATSIFINTRSVSGTRPLASNRWYPPSSLIPATIAPLRSNLGAISHLSDYNRGPKQQRFPPSPPRNRLTAGLASIGTAGVVLAGKGKYLLGALKLTKFASLGSMLVTVGTYSMFYGLPFAAGMVGLILVHESGHALVMRKLGIPFSPMVFVPFIGAAVQMKRLPRDAYDEALVAFGGPVLGSVGACAVGAAGLALDSNLLIALADFGFMINLFNLLPIGMMDGGRICGALSRWSGVAGLGIGGGLIYAGAISNPIFYLVMVAGGWDTFQKFYNPAGHLPKNYYAITAGQRATITAGYFGLVAALIGAMSVSSSLKKSPEELVRERRLGVYHHPQDWN